ncbi:MAG: PilZ domain-containing protein [Lachnospiraceae bacterium]|nr:PilZ domain-containing protein [Lachnospiraceae bacterium]
MGIKLSELEEGCQIRLLISNKDNSMTLGAWIKNIVKDSVAIIALDYPPGKRLVFDNVNVDLEYGQEEDVPILWKSVRIANYKGEYVLQTTEDGRRHNRRGCFRIGVGVKAALCSVGRGPGKVMIRDVSLSGYSITDRKKELDFKVGEKVEVYFEDLGHVLNLMGNVVRIEEHEDMNIYGLEITNICKDLSSYISVKQRHKS